MIVVNDPRTRSFDGVQDLGVVIKELPRPQGQIHIGLLYREPGAPARASHLYTNFDFRDEPVQADFFWIQATMPDLTRQLVVGLCKRIAAHNPRIPYSFKYRFKQQYFQPSGALALPNTDDGLTCATYVLAVFQRLKIPILKFIEWPRDRHGAWQTGMISALTAKSYPERGAQMDAWMSQIGEPRYLPQEVAAGVGASAQPIGYARATELAAQIVDDIRRARAAG